MENEVKNLNDLLTKLENKIYEFTNAIKRGKEIQKNLLDLNKKIAHLQVVETYKNYLKQSEEMKGLKEDLEQKRDKHKKIKEHLDSLKQKKSDMSLAINTINNALNYVFFSKERLSIELKNDKYYLKSRGKNVLPKDISMGERNIIALCYFFTQMFSNQDIKNLYKYEQLVVIDDPVSSFDFENRVGIITYIRYEINKIIKGNNNSKILIFSHDLATIYDLQKATGEICKSIGKNKHGVKVTSSIMKLDNKKLDDFKKNAGEYRELLLNVYAYANGTFNGDEITIGNSMRRVLEAFSTFNYCKGVQDVLISPNVLQALGNKSLYFENLMSRLVLHGESHFEEQIYNLHDDANFYQFISNEEKKRTAKDILCFIFILNKYHIKSYFDENQKAIKNIELWVNKIPNNSEFEIDELNKEISPKRKIKLFDISLSAGTGNHIFDNVEYQEYETDCEDCDFALKISGDSMQPTIPDSSIVLLKRSIEIKAEDIGAFYLNGEVFCKRIKKEGDFILLCSDNTKYKPIKVKEYDTFETYGKVVKIVK